MSDQLLKEILDEIKMIKSDVSDIRNSVANRKSNSRFNHKMNRKPGYQPYYDTQAMFDYCDSNGTHPMDLTPEEMDRFRLRERKPQNEAIFDARPAPEDINTIIIDALDRIEAKLDVLQIETAHLRRVR